MAGKNSASDNPWAEMSRLNLTGKESKAPAPESTRAATAKAEEIAGGNLAKGAAVSAAAATAADADTDTEYTEEDLQNLSLKELQALADEAGIDFKGLSKDDLISALLDDGSGSLSSDDEEEVELEDEEELETEEIDGEMSLEEALKLLGEDVETEEDFSDAEFEEVETEVQEGDANFELDDNNPTNG